MTELNAVLNQALGIEVRDGSFFEPVLGETFDLIVTNPPFVISPATGERLVYRDSGLPGDRVVEDIVRAAPRPPQRRRLVPGPGQLGHLAGRSPGRSGSASWLDGVATAGSSSARWSTRRRTSSCGSRTPACRGPPSTCTATTPGWPGSRSRASRPSASAGSTCARVGRPPSSASRTGPTTWSSRSAPTCTSRAGHALAVAVDEHAAASSYGPTSCRRRSASPAPRIPTRSCCASSADCAEPVRSTRSRLRWSGPATASSRVGQILDAVAQLLELEPAATRESYHPMVADLVREGFLVAR